MRFIVAPWRGFAVAFCNADTLARRAHVICSQPPGIQQTVLPLYRVELSESDHRYTHVHDCLSFISSSFNSNFPICQAVLPTATTGSYRRCFVINCKNIGKKFGNWKKRWMENLSGLTRQAYQVYHRKKAEAILQRWPESKGFWRSASTNLQTVSEGTHIYSAVRLSLLPRRPASLPLLSVQSLPLILPTGSLFHLCLLLLVCLLPSHQLFSHLSSFYHSRDTRVSNYSHLFISLLFSNIKWTLSIFSILVLFRFHSVVASSFCCSNSFCPSFLSFFLCQTFNQLHPASPSTLIKSTDSRSDPFSFLRILQSLESSVKPSILCPLTPTLTPPCVKFPLPHQPLPRSNAFTRSTSTFPYPYIRALTSRSFSPRLSLSLQNSLTFVLLLAFKINPLPSTNFFRIVYEASIGNNHSTRNFLDYIYLSNMWFRFIKNLKQSSTCIAGLLEQVQYTRVDDT